MAARANILRRLSRGVVLVVLTGTILLLAGEALADSAVTWKLPKDVSTHGHKIDNLFNIITWLTGIVFVLVEVTLVIFLFKYRGRPGQKAKYTHGSTKVEMVWTVIPAVIIFSLALFSRGLWADLKQNMPADALNVKVMGEQFAWNVIYPGPDGMLDTIDDIVALNEMHVPLNQPVVVSLTSKDVIHSFFLPQFRVKQDAVPGLTSRVWLQGTETGTFDIACAELCGLGHYRMRGFISVDEPADFEAWLQELAAEADE